MTNNKGNIDEYINSLRESQQFSQDVAYYKVISEKPAIKLSPATPFSKEIKKIITSYGVNDLYSHQAKAIDNIRNNQNG